LELIIVVFPSLSDDLYLYAQHYHKKLALLMSITIDTIMHIAA